MIVRGGAGATQPGNPLDKDDEGVFISKINPNGAAARDGRLKPGMRIIEVNEHSLLGAPHQEAVQHMRNAGNKIVLLVCDGYDPSEVPKKTNGSEIPTPTSPTARSFKSFSSVDKEDDEVFSASTPKSSEHKTEKSVEQSTKVNDTSAESVRSQSSHVISNSVANHSNAIVSEQKSVDQKVVDVVKAADQLSRTSNAFSSQTNSSKEQKTTTVIMKKHNVNTGVAPPQQATTVSLFLTFDDNSSILRLLS